MSSCSTPCPDDSAVVVSPTVAEAQCCLPVQVTDLEGEVLDLKGQLADLEAIRLDLEGHVQDLSDELHGAAAERADKAKAVKVSWSSKQSGREPFGALICYFLFFFHYSVNIPRGSSFYPWCPHCRLNSSCLYDLVIG